MTDHVDASRRRGAGGALLIVALLVVPLGAFAGAAALAVSFAPVLVLRTLAKEHRELAIELPEAPSAVLVRPSSGPLIITINEDGGVRIDGEVIEPDALPARLQEAARSDPLRPVLVRADRDTRAAQIVEVIDACAMAGFRDISIRTPSWDETP